MKTKRRNVRSMTSAPIAISRRQTSALTSRRRARDEHFLSSVAVAVVMSEKRHHENDAANNHSTQEGILLPTSASLPSSYGTNMSEKHNSSVASGQNADNDEYLGSVFDRPPPYAPTEDSSTPKIAKNYDDRSYPPSAPSYGFVTDMNTDPMATGQNYNERLNNAAPAPGAEPPPPYDSRKAPNSIKKDEWTCLRRTATFLGCGIMVFGFIMAICWIALLPMTMSFEGTFEETHEKASKMFTFFALAMVFCILGCCVTSIGSVRKPPPHRVIIIRDTESV